jgi:beta-hydroxylase
MVPENEMDGLAQSLTLPTDTGKKKKRQWLVSAGLAKSAYRTPHSFKLRNLVLVGLAVFFIPSVFAFYLCCGVLDVMRNKRRTFATIDRYFAGNGAFTWLLSPFNLLMDLLSLPYWNKGIYKLADLPGAYQDEINTIIEAAHLSDVVGKLESKIDGQRRGMIFFKWYGKNVPASIEVPEFHRDYRYVRTIGVSVFNKKQSTGKHYGPLRVTLRVLYNINTIADRNVYIKVGNQTNYWQDNKLFIFDDTLQHQSFNESDDVRYCLFVDILRPSLCPLLMSVILTGLRLLIAPFNAVFYKQWTMIK